MSTGAATIAAKRSGVYRAPVQVEALQKAASKAGLAWIDLPLQAVSNKKQFLAVCAKQLKLPSYFGGNWDALADCVRDFNWLGGKGYVLHITGYAKFANAVPNDYQTALDVLREAADYWKEKGSAFVVLIDGAKDLPAF
jgi:RNAse (barnase) inhibitor barstar